MPQNAPSWRGPALALTTALTWGLLPLAMKQVLAVMDPLTITFYRFLVAAVLLLVWQGKQGQLSAFARLNSRQWGILVLAGLLLNTNYGGYQLGLNFMDPASSQMLIQLAPMLLLLGGVLLYKEPFSRAQGAGVGVLLLGLGLFFHDALVDIASGSNPEFLTGLLFIDLAAVTWAGYALLQKKLLAELGSLNILMFICAQGAMVFWPMATPGQLVNLDGIELGLLTFGCLNTLVGYGAFAESLRYWPASKVSAVLALTPLVTLLSMDLLWLVMGVSLHGDLDTDWLVYLGGLVVIYGSMLSTLGKWAIPGFLRRG